MEVPNGDEEAVKGKLGKLGRKGTTDRSSKRLDSCSNMEHKPVWFQWPMQGTLRLVRYYIRRLRFAPVYLDLGAEL